MNVEFIFIPEIKVILIAEYTTKLDLNFKSIFYVDNLLKPTSSISVNDTVYTITASII